MFAYLSIPFFIIGVLLSIIAKNTEDDNKKLRKILYLFATVFIIIGLCFIFENTKFYKGFFNAFN